MIEDEDIIRNDERLDIILDIVGHIGGIGETNYDEISLNNLDFLYLLLCRIFERLKDNATYDGYEGSMIDIKEKSLEMLKECGVKIDGIVNESEEQND